MFPVHQYSSNLNSFPQELGLHILSQLDPIEDMGAVACVSTEWNRLAGLNELWNALFIKTFQEKAPEGENVKVAFLKRCALPVADESQLWELFGTFWCTAEWDKKKRIECVFSTNPPSSIIAEHSFGPNRGTEVGIKGPADQTKYYKYIGKVPNDLKLNQDASISTYQVGNTRLFQSTNEERYSHFFYTCFSVGAEVDVGYGNTLGYFSSRNDWKKPFKLTCVQTENKDSHVWAGSIPYSVFKFIKINREGKITWENGIQENRAWHSRSSGRPYNWDQYLQAFPITFPK